MIDTATIKAKAGNGGDGLVSFRHEKHLAKGGPWGGDGGNGGDLIIKVDIHQNTLTDFRRQKEYKAPNGMPGMKNLKKGKSGEDLTIYVPKGTLVYNQNGELIVDLIDEKQEFILQKGGRGGLGNYHFKSSTNQTPFQYTTGEKREMQLYNLELKLIADVGIIGLPSAGKSTLLNILTRANAKTGEYPFTTLEPNLGVLHVNNFLPKIKQDIVLADIPGLIEGASQGKGLGHDFLKHIERTKILVHVIDGFDATQKTNADKSQTDKPLQKIDPEVLASNYKTIRNELSNWNKDLLNKEEIIVINKAELLQEVDIMTKIQKALNNPNILFISAYTGKNIPQLVELLLKIMQKQNQIIQNQLKGENQLDQNHNQQDQSSQTQIVKKIFTISDIRNKRLMNLQIQTKPKRNEKFTNHVK